MKTSEFALLLLIAAAGCGSSQVGGSTTNSGTAGATVPKADPAAAVQEPHGQEPSGKSVYTPAELAGVWKLTPTEEDRRQAKEEGIDLEAGLPTLTLGRDRSFIFAEPEGQMSGTFQLSGKTLTLSVEMAYGEPVADPSAYRAPAFEVAEAGKALVSPPGPDGKRLEFRRR